MAKAQNYAGTDISKETFDVWHESNGKVRSKKFTYDEQGLQSLLSCLPEAAYCVMESTGTYHCRLAYLLYGKDIALSVVNPLSAKRFAQALMLRTKIDRPDSRSLMLYGQHLHPAGWKPKPDVQAKMQQIVVANKLIKQAFSLLIGGRDYMDNYCVKNIPLINVFRNKWLDGNTVFCKGKA
jgi:transposase